MKQITKRLKNGEDLLMGIKHVVSENKIKAGVIVSIVGSLSKVVLRMSTAVPDNPVIKTREEMFEIVGATGTLSLDGNHIHISVSDKDGGLFGGHLKEGCIVRTTAELVVLSFDDIEYKRIMDPDTGYKELSF